MSDVVASNSGNAIERKLVSRPMRLLALVALLLPCIACDQATKALAVANLKGAGSIHIVDGFFRLVYAENPGAFLGLGRSLPDGARMILFVVATAVVLVSLTFVLVRKQIAPAAFLGIALLVAGGFGNLIDRVARPGGRVVDFAQMGIGPVRTGVFNVADVHIMVGAGLLLLSSVRRRKTDPTPGDALPETASTR